MHVAEPEGVGELRPGCCAAAAGRRSPPRAGGPRWWFTLAMAMHW